MSNFIKLKALSLLEWQVLLGALIMLPVVALSLKIIGYNRTITLLNRTIAVAPVPVHAPADQIKRARLLARMVSIAANHGPYHANCLKQSLVLYWILARRRIPAEIRFGVQKDVTQDLHAHAWVEHAGINLSDNEVIQQQIAPFHIPPDTRQKNGHLM